MSQKIDPKNQFVAGGIVLASVCMTIGNMFGFSAILLPQLEDENIRTANSDEASWIASVVNVSQVLGAVVSGMLSGSIGPKKVILISSLFMVIGWAFIGFSEGDYTLIMIGRLIHGGFFVSSVTQVYLAEICDSKRRAMIAGSGPLFVNTGITVVYILGALLPWRIVCFVCASLPVSTILLSKWIPESPVWLKNNQRTEEAKEILKLLRGRDYDTTSEMMSTQDSAEEGTSIAKKCENLLSNLMKPEAFKPFLMMLMLFTLQQACGSFAVIFYAVNVFQDAGAVTSPYFAAILTAVVRQLGTFFGAILLQRFSRKSLMVASSGIMAVSMISLVEIVAYMLAFGIGVGLVPWLLLGELCPAEVKCLTSGVAACHASAMVFVVVKTFPLLVTMIGSSGAYYFFAAMCVLTVGFSLIFVPDTRGKTSAELELLYAKK